jgi:hypothetical protein
MDSRTLYGSGTPTAYELGLYPQGRRAYGLRSANALDGYAPAYGSRPSKRKAKPEPVSPEREQARLRLAQAQLMRQLQREHEREQAERREAYLASVRQVEAYN